MHRDTSHDAQLSLRPVLPHLEQRVWEQIVKQGTYGMTCDELEQFLDLSHQTASARCTALYHKGRIVDSGHRRRTRSGRGAIVWLAHGEDR